MSVSKAELERINGGLQSALRCLKIENDSLTCENQRLSAALASANAQSEKMSARYQKLVAYVKQLRDWLDANAS